MLAAHDDICAAVGLAGDDAHLGHSGLGIGIQKLGPVTNDPAVLLSHARHEAGDVGEGDQRDVKGIAESDKPGRLYRGIYVQHASQIQRLLRYHAYWPAVHPGKSNDDVGSKQAVDLHEVAFVHHLSDYLLHIIGLRGVLRNGVKEILTDPVGWISRLQSWRVLGVVGGKKRKQASNLLETILVRVIYKMGDAAFGGVGQGAAQLLMGNLLARHRFDNVGASDIHLAGAPHHEGEIGDGRGVYGSSSGGPHDDGDLRDDARGQGVSLEDLAVSRQAVYPFLNAGATGIVETYCRGTVFHGQVHDLADLLGNCLRQGAAHDGEILGEDKDRSTAYSSVTGYNGIAGVPTLCQTEIRSPVQDKGVQLFEGARVQKKGNAFAGGELAPGVLLLDALLAST